MKKLFWTIVLLVLICGGGVIGWKFYNVLKQQEESNNSAKEKKAVAFAVDAVLAGKMNMQDKRMFSGSLVAWSVYDISPKVSGRLIKLPYNIGDRVENGKLIAQLNDDEYLQAYQQVAADVDLVKARLNEAKIILNLREQEHARVSTLAAQSINSKAQLESAETALLTQKANITMLNAEIKRAEAVLANAKVKLDETVMSADWAEEHARFVGQRYVDEGALIAANQPIVSIAEIDRLKASIFVIERDYPYLAIDQEAEIYTDAYPDVAFKGRVAKISQTLQESSRQAHVLLEIDNHDLRLKPGMFVKVFLEFARKDNTTVVPQSAVVKRDGKVGVFEIDEKDNTVKFLEVKLGISNRLHAEILSPELTKPLATLGNHLLSDGTLVKVPNQITTINGVTE